MCNTNKGVNRDVFASCFMIALFIILILTAGDQNERTYIDKENNLICTIKDNSFSCLPYNDEGDRLEIIQPSVVQP